MRGGPLRAALAGLVVHALAAAAQDECADTAKRAVCAQAAQQCVDPTPGEPPADDWACECVAPEEGAAATAAAAQCRLNECTAQCPTCAKTATGDVCSDVGQLCLDAFRSTYGSWTCVCSGTSVGAVSFMSPAECVLNECSDTNIANVCSAAGQTCLDPVPDPTFLNDWVCLCPAPGLGAAMGTAAVCDFDECRSGFQVCSSAGQTCVDANAESVSLRDWTCVCQGSASGEAALGVAACIFTDECSSDKCAKPGQTCVDIDAATPDDWSCQCMLPFVGPTVTAGATTCVIDECTAECASCAKTPTGDVCSDAGQRCLDRDTSATSIRDWECSCVSPSTGVSQPTGIAFCVLNECVQSATTCTAAEDQHCEDPNPSPTSLNDWKCVCDPPAEGEAVRGPAVCVFDECIGKEACTVAGQTCSDPDKSVASTGDWICSCEAPSTGSSVASAATCVYPPDDECTTFDSVCAANGQSCVDPDTSVAGDWECRCVAPSTGVSAVAEATVCAFDECLLVCATCADTDGSGNRCTAAHQMCVDSVKQPSSLNDWECRCPPGSSGSPGAAAAAVCLVDECASITCPTGQTCTDLNPSASSTGDWQCSCILPYVGSAVATSAVCNYDECIAKAPVCRAARQECNDPDLTVEGNWMCVCPPPATESAVKGTATCSDEGECSNKICENAGQSCRDPTGLSVTDDWSCTCILPEIGAPKPGGPAECSLDECVQQCETCAVSAHSAGHSFGNICTDAGQLCRDPNTSPASTGDWECSCVAESTGTASTASVATCVLDECADPTNAGACGAEQVCIDASTAFGSVGDWRCQCNDPWLGSQNTGGATCRLPPTGAPPTLTPTQAPDTAVPDTPRPQTLPPTTSAPDTAGPPSLAPGDTPAPATPTPTDQTPTPTAQTPLPTAGSPPPTDASSTNVPKSSTTPTDAPQGNAPQTNVPKSSTTPTDAPQGNAPPTNVPKSSTTPTGAPQGNAPPTNVPKSGTVPTDAPNGAATRVPHTASPANSTATPVPRTDVPPETDAPGVDVATHVPYTATPANSTATPVPRTDVPPETDAPVYIATHVPYTATPANSTATPVPRTDVPPETDAPVYIATHVPYTATPANSTATPVPRTDVPPETDAPVYIATHVPYTATPANSTATPVPRTDVPPETYAPYTATPANSTATPLPRPPGADGNGSGICSFVSEPECTALRACMWDSGIAFCVAAEEEDSDEGDDDDNSFWILIIVLLAVACLVTLGVAFCKGRKAHGGHETHEGKLLVASGDEMVKDRETAHDDLRAAEAANEQLKRQLQEQAATIEAKNAAIAEAQWSAEEAIHKKNWLEQQQAQADPAPVYLSEEDSPGLSFSSDVKVTLHSPHSPRSPPLTHATLATTGHPLAPPTASSPTPRYRRLTDDPMGMAPPGSQIASEGYAHQSPVPRAASVSNPHNPSNPMPSSPRAPFYSNPGSPASSFSLSPPRRKPSMQPLDEILARNGL
ncbi:hypothetical protein DIPPA_19555 [Diplonema papillatum]|nr:hypothetical protein DIPPA_19555 [Diplonema papillatum]